MLLADPHNIELGVLFAGGIIGLLLWVAIYALAFGFSWKNRKSPAVLLASTWLVFGLAAGLTEGNASAPSQGTLVPDLDSHGAAVCAVDPARFAASRRGEDIAAP